MFRHAILFLLLLSVACPLHAASYHPNGDLVGKVKYYTVRKHDSLSSIARRFDVGIVELLAANPGLDARQPKEGAELFIPTQHVLPAVRKGIVLNLSELRLFYFGPDGSVLTFPVGIGREGWETPTGKTVVWRKRKDPTWIPPESIREENPDLPDLVPAGPKNPLGGFAMNLGWPGYLIHGTNLPSSIGKRASHGCIRLYPEDIKVLFNAVSEGTPVTVIDTPYKLGWQGSALYLEATPSPQQADAVAQSRTPQTAAIPGLYEAVEMAARGAEVDWYAVDQAVIERSGLPVQIAGKTP